LIFLIIILIFISITFILYYFEKNRTYTEEEFTLKRVENPNDNTYYFQIPISFYQYRKMEEVKKRYSQNSIIYCEEDNSYHRVLKWGANVQGIQRIIAEPYIVEEVVPSNNYTVYISNYGSLYIDLSETYVFDKLYQEISEENFNISPQEKGTALNALKDIKESKVIRKKSLENLCDFLEKYEALFSYASNVLSIISSIIGFM